jgi:hypothetical protein
MKPANEKLNNNLSKGWKEMFKDINSVKGLSYSQANTYQMLDRECNQSSYNLLKAYWDIQGILELFARCSVQPEVIRSKEKTK